MQTPPSIPQANADSPASPGVVHGRHYLAYRPPYPESMWKLWLSFHVGPLTSAHDIGSGSGNAVEDLLRHAPATLKHVLLTEPQKLNSEDCQARFHNRFPDTRFSYRNCRIEDPFETPSDMDHLDFVMACESLHWTIVELAVKNVTKSLRNNGTFAVVNYAPFPIIRSNPAANGALKNFIAEHASRLEKEEWMNESWKRVARNLSRGLDYVPLSEDVWKDVKRIDINCQDGWFAINNGALYGTAEAIPRLGACERIAIDDSKDWQHTVSVEWLRQCLVSMRFGFTEESWTSPHWRRIEVEVGDGSLDLTWQVQMLLARKRTY